MRRLRRLRDLRRSAVLAAVLAGGIAMSACAGGMSAARTGTRPTTTTTPPAPTSPATPTRTPPPPTRPARVRVPDGWTDVLAAPRAEVEARAPGLYDEMQARAARDGYLVMAMDLDPSSPDHNSQMTELRLGTPGPVDAALLDRFVAGNNLGLAPEDIVEKRLLDVGGRPIAKVRAEYQGAEQRIDTLTYLFPDDRGDVLQLVFTVRAERYAALRPQLEAIEAAPR